MIVFFFPFLFEISVDNICISLNLFHLERETEREKNREREKKTERQKNRETQKNRERERDRERD